MYSFVPSEKPASHLPFPVATRFPSIPTLEHADRAAVKRTAQQSNPRSLVHITRARLTRAHRPKMASATPIAYSEAGIVELEVNGQRLRVAQTSDTDTIGTTIWSSSRAQLAFFAAGGRPRRALANRSVLELGAGCGLAGLGLGLLGASRVCLTDTGDAVLRNLQRNVSLNANAAEAAAAAGGLAAPCRFSVCGLEWAACAADGPPPGLAAELPADIVVASDVVYSEAAVAPLVGTLRAVMGPRSLAWITNEDRNRAATELFLQTLKRDFAVKRLRLPRGVVTEGTDTYTLFLRLRRSSRAKGGEKEDGEEDAEERAADEGEDEER